MLTDYVKLIVIRYKRLCVHICNLILAGIVYMIDIRRLPVAFTSLKLDANRLC